MSFPSASFESHRRAIPLVASNGERSQLSCRMDMPCLQFGALGGYKGRWNHGEHGEHRDCTESLGRGDSELLT